MKIKRKWIKIRNIIRKTYHSLFSYKNKEFYVFLLFLGISILFWFLQSTQAVTQSELSIPLQYGKLPENIIITNELPRSLRVTILDKGSHLYHYYFRRRALTLNIDLMRWRQEDGIGRIPLKQLETTIFSKLKPSAQILRISPDSLIVYYVEKEHKELPVRLNAQLGLTQQYMLIEEPSIQPSFVTAYAPASILDSLKEIETEWLNLSVLKDTLTLSVKLKAIEGVHFSQPAVSVYLPIEEFTEHSFEIPIQGLGFPKDLLLRSFPSRVTVSFLVNKSNYSSIKADDFNVGINYADILSSDENLQMLHLIKAPEFVRRLSLNPDKVECLIEKK